MISILNDLEFMDAQVHKNIAIIPLKTPSNYGFDVITLKKGFELGLVEVKECETSTVNTLVVKNNAVTPLLLVDGEEIIGGDQNRIVNATILIEAKSEMKVPVNCTEHGRWGYKHEFRHSNYMANYRTRSAKIRASIANGDEQGAVWDAIDVLENSRDFSSPTQAMSESYDNAKVDLSEFADAFDIKKGQSGVVVLVDGEMKGFEIFLNSDVYSQYHEKIIKSYLIDAEINDSVFTIDIDLIKNRISKALDSKVKKSKNNGLESHFDFKNDEGMGTLYTFQDELMHLSYFTGAEDGSNSDAPNVNVDYDDVTT